MSESLTATSAASTTSVLRLVPDLDENLTGALARVEELLLLVAAWVSDAPEEAPAAPIGDGTALAALRRIGDAVRPTQGSDRPRLLAPDGRYEHVPIRPAHVEAGDLTAWAQSAQQLREEPRSDRFGLVAEAIDTAETGLQSSDWRAPPIVAEADRLSRLLMIAPTYETSLSALTQFPR